MSDFLPSQKFFLKNHFATTKFQLIINNCFIIARKVAFKKEPAFRGNKW